MTNNNNFLDLDIKKLFEEHSIKDIELIQKQIQHESDRKKIELRTLVGERYRDLIQAADMIAEMNQTSEMVADKVHRIEETLITLQQKYSVGFNIETEPLHQKRDTKHISDSVVLQIKILIEIPECIWSAIDEKNFLLATQLFMLAQHINYSLAIEVGESDLINRYPIASKQLVIINQFRVIIHNFCNNALLSVDLTEELAANCLSALVLLDNLSSSDLLNKLLSSTNSTVKSIILSESSLNVKSRVKLSLKVLIDTIPIISTCFLKHQQNEENLVSKRINALKNVDALSLLGQLDVDKNLVDICLPVITKIHKPFERFEMQDLSLDYIQECLKKWFEWIRIFSQIEIKKLLELITSVRGVNSIREESLAVKIPDNWESIWKNFDLKSVNFWTEFFQPLLTERVKEVLSNKLNTCLQNLRSNLYDLLEILNKEGRENSEIDLRWFIWKDSPSDIPQKLTELNLLDNKRPLLMKARGFSPNIVNICENFEKDLSELLIDLKQYLYEDDQAMSLKDELLTTNFYLSINKYSDCTEIQEYLQQESKLLIETFVKHVKENFLTATPRIGNQDENAIVIARFFQALTVLCVNFKECFTLSRSTGLSLTSIRWEEICDHLRKESTEIWTKWSESFIGDILKRRTEYLSPNITDNYFAHVSISDWEKVVIEEVADEGRTITSKILVPYQPSVNLQRHLSSICTNLNKIIPHTMPKTVLNEIIEKVSVDLLNYYSDIVDGEDIRQKQAIQLLFDVKFISLLMISRRNKNLTEQSNKLSNSFVSKIDPFDFDVFYPFINTNVKKAAQRSLLIFGILVPHMEQLHSILGARIDHDSSKSIMDPPGILATSNGTPWFPPLAVTAPVKGFLTPGMSVMDKSQIKKKLSTKDQNKTDFASSSIKSGAAAFFGAMGSDWFGTS